MPNYYTYIISSLPMLNFQTKAAITGGKLLDFCLGLVSDEEYSLLEAILEEKELPKVDYKVLRGWLLFDTALRNELVNKRAGRRKRDPLKYLRQSQYWDADIIHAAMAAYKSTSILEAEKILDLERWRFLDELCFGHYFDFEFLIIYAFKLKILERWEKINKADKPQLLEGVLN